VAKNTLRAAGDFTGGKQPDQIKPGTTTGSAAKGYSELECDGSSYDKYGWRADYGQLSSHTFK
jgi:hypothetical protein